MKTLSTSLIAILIFSLILLALPELGHSGFPNMAGGPPCCSFSDRCDGGNNALFLCENFSGCSGGEFCDFVPNGTCVVEDGIGSCVILPSNVPIPTLSEWGLIALAGILGIVGFMVIRRRKAVA